MSDMQRRIELARAMLADFDTSRPTTGNGNAATDIRLRYSQMESLLGLLVAAYDAEHAAPEVPR